jgi:hypothetical protein
VTDIVNGADHAPLAGWSIVVAHGLTMLGRLNGSRLQPAYGLTCVMQMVQTDPRQRPQLMTVRQVMPLLTYPSIRSVDVIAAALVIPVEQLSTAERRDLAKSVEACDQLIAGMRAQEAGVVLAPASALPRRP